MTIRSLVLDEAIIQLRNQLTANYAHTGHI